MQIHLVLIDTTQKFHTALVPIYSLPTMYERSSLLHIIIHLCIFYIYIYLFILAILLGVVSHCGFNLLFPND